MFFIIFQVKLVNAPEIMSKYLGESEKNLRLVGILMYH